MYIIECKYRSKFCQLMTDKYKTFVQKHNKSLKISSSKKEKGFGV